jgi:hypothetical protein
MNTADLNSASIALRKGEILRLHRARGQRIEALSGYLWVTMDNDLRDIVVAPGHGFRVDGDGDTLLSAIADSRFVLLEPVEGRLPSGAY